MNNFNKVFLSVKKHCERQRGIAEINCFDKVAADAKVPMDSLSIYLDHLQNLGLIRYSLTEKYIYLTAFGRKQEQLTPE